MKLSNETSAFRIGDTSFRRADYDTSIPEILKSLDENKKQQNSWSNYKGESKQIVQQRWYDDLVESTSLFERQKSDKNERTNDGLRARTLVQAISKLGFTNGNDLTPIGQALVSESTKPLDALERIINLDSLSSTFLRQLLKVRIYSGHDSLSEQKYFSPFLYTLEFLLHFDRVPSRDMNYILEGIRPSMTKEELVALRDDYSKVYSGEEEFFTYYYNHFTKHISTNEDDENIAERLLIEIETFINEGMTLEVFTDKYLDNPYYIEKFGSIFKNSKGSTYVKRYAGFLFLLITARVKKNDESIIALIKEYQSSDVKTSINSAFGREAIVARGNTFEKFNQNQNQNYRKQLLAGKPGSKLWLGTYKEIYSQFILEKFINNVSEYADLITRYLNVSRIISSENKLYKLRLKPLFSELFKYTENIWLGSDNRKKYEEDRDGIFKTEQTLSEILGIGNIKLTQIIKNEIRKANIESSSSIKNEADLVKYYRHNESQEFYEMVEQKFPRNKTIQILRDIVAYDGRKGSAADNRVMDQVTHNVNTPSIFEYMLGIAWWYLTDKNVNIYFAYNLRLDSNFMPTGAASGGQGDIEIDYNDFGLLLEATVQNKNSQKAGEMEPVIRHTVNLNTRTSIKKKPWYGLFVATELDNNVVNIFRSVQWITLEDSSNKELVTEGVGIFALTTFELIKLLEKGTRMDSKIIEVFKSTLSSEPQKISLGWRELCVSQLLTD
ncbi:hypothetical protein R82265_HNDDMDAM_00788 [Fructobacillus cardui]|uniref:AlwI family type II restriction endonuclease n=1 Tax=Fructobacillus cardui TaxID=2893170 RepID=UPI002DA9A0FE|nr:hypothetical protein R82265_HNDDMDAM_00788 [Fructobacillus cardui]